jgi:peroxiredoxin
MRSSGRISSIVLAFLLSLLAGQESFGGTQVSEAAWAPKEGIDLIGRQAPEFKGLRWLNCEPLSMTSLRGKIVLIRFWLIECPLCSGSAEALNTIYEKYRNKGLVVIGIHHPKSEPARESPRVIEGANKLGFQFPIAQDNDWETIRSFWLTKKRGYTSASILIDQSGQIRWIHDGGTLPLDSPAYRSLEAALRKLIEPHPTASQ